MLHIQCFFLLIFTKFLFVFFFFFFFGGGRGHFWLRFYLAAFFLTIFLRSCPDLLHLLLILFTIAWVQFSVFIFIFKCKFCIVVKICKISCCIFDVCREKNSPKFWFFDFWIFFPHHIWTQILFASIFLNNFSKNMPRVLNILT